MAHIYLEDVISEAIGEAKGSIHTILPATLESYDHATQTGDISYDLKTLWVDPETDAERWISVPGAGSVPVVHYPGIISDLEPGTKGLALISERDIDRYKNTGAAGTQPADRRKFNRNDAIFLPGIYPGTPNESAREGRTVLPAGDIRLGGPDVATKLARADRVEAELGEVKRRLAALRAMVTTLGTSLPAAPVTGGALEAALLSAETTVSALPFPSDTAADKVYGE